MTHEKYYHEMAKKYLEGIMQVERMATMGLFDRRLIKRHCKKYLDYRIEMPTRTRYEKFGLFFSNSRNNVTHMLIKFLNNMTRRLTDK